MVKLRYWRYFYKICCKYNIKWSPFEKIGRGVYKDVHPRPIITVNPFSKYFLEIALHEVGHHIARRAGYDAKYEEYFNTTPQDQWVMLQGQPYSVMLREESFASRFAAKANNQVDREVLVEFFQTYTAVGYKSRYVDSTELTDTIAPLIRRIQNV